ncbi:MAG: ABC transporter ATP-binding protein, partial [Candidatus Hydrogenedentota bacterium]
TVGLDPKQIIEVRNLIKSLAGKRTIILSTHILPEVSMICDNVAIIHEGRIVAKDSITHLETEQQMTICLLASGPAEEILSILSSVEGVEKATSLRSSKEDVPEGKRFEVTSRPGADPRARISAAIVGNGWELIELRQETLSLEDIFIRATAREGEVE